jgi:hypothetical protein
MFVAKSGPGNIMGVDRTNSCVQNVEAAVAVSFSQNQTLCGKDTERAAGSPNHPGKRLDLAMIKTSRSNLLCKLLNAKEPSRCVVVGDVASRTEWLTQPCSF